MIDIDIRELLLGAIAVLITLTVHEYAHAYAAYKLGDTTAKSYGRLSLNPLKHLDPIGAICLLFFRFGWAKPVPINARNFKNPKRGFAITALAGPLVNILLAFIFYGLFYGLYIPLLTVVFENAGFRSDLAFNFLYFLNLFAYINVGLGIFNLLPIPPFDGSRLLNVFLPPKAYFGIMKYERQIYFGVLIWLLAGSYVAAAVRSIPFIASSPILYNISGIFSLSGMINTVIQYIAGLMADFWIFVLPI